MLRFPHPNWFCWTTAHQSSVLRKHLLILFVSESTLNQIYFLLINMKIQLAYKALAQRLDHRYLLLLLCSGFLPCAKDAFTTDNECKSKTVRGPSMIEVLVTHWRLNGIQVVCFDTDIRCAFMIQDSWSNEKWRFSYCIF